MPSVGLTFYLKAELYARLYTGAGVGNKKRYEVPRLTRLVADVQKKTCSSIVLDIGSGLVSFF